MFRTVAIIGFVATFIAIVLHFVVSRLKFLSVSGKDSLPLRPTPVVHKSSVLCAIRTLVFLLALLSFIIQVVTGFVPKIFLESSITGWWLMVHATSAPVFAACISILAMLWVDRNRLDKNYWPWLNKALHREPKSTTPPGKYEFKLKICFWVVIVLSLPVILTAILNMFKLFGTYWQEVLLEVHRYSTLVMSLFAIVYLYLAAMSRIH